jgi:flagellar biosynthesis GTPase FlhF
MNVKRYRAASMREALEKVKSELGEDALVLDSKRVTSGGFLGIGSREEIEVRVAGTASPASNQNNGQQQRKPNITTLSLNEDAPAKPTASPALQRNNTSAFSALAARAYSTDSRPPRQDQHVTTLGPPNHGRPLALPFQGDR